MWSGPRNVSTALMRSFGSRADAEVRDEPFYAHYLARTGLEHPGREEVLARHESDSDRVIEAMLGPLGEGVRISYQKHMAHHILEGMDLSWMDGMRHAFLIRDPASMIASYAAVRESPTLEDLGAPQMSLLFKRVRERTGVVPPVVDARDLLEDPRSLLSALCDSLGMPFDEAMLSWEPGPRSTDGAWAPHWYASVEQSTGFAPYRPRELTIPDELHGVLAECEESYRTLHAIRLGA